MHALTYYTSNSCFQDSLTWFQLETQFVLIIIPLEPDFFYCYATLFHIPPSVYMFQKCLLSFL